MERLVVTCLSGARQGDRFEFEPDAAVTFGRHPSSSVVLPEQDGTASGRHAEASFVDGRWYVRDVGSLNGTWHGDDKLSKPLALGELTVIELGRGGPQLRLEVVSDGERVGNTTMVPVAALLAGREAPQRADTSPRRSTAFYRFLIDDTVKRSNRRLKWVVIGFSAAVVVVIAVLWIVLSQRTERLSVETASVRAAEQIVTRFGKSVFMLIEDDGVKQTGFCTAFAISPDGLLATNAHCVRELKDLRARGMQDEAARTSGTPRLARILARMNTAPDNTFEVITWKEHPEYDGTDLSPDVALLGLDLKGATLPVVADIATPEVALALAAGQPIFTLGFPGQVMNEARPAADLRAAVVSRLTTRDNTPGEAREAYVVWHSALTSKGTSGSPIFDTLGRVVAINNGGLSAREILAADPETGKVRRLTISEATGLNYGIRIDRLADLWVAN